jgi:hypothetical protein
MSGDSFMDGGDLCGARVSYFQSSKEIQKIAAPLAFGFALTVRSDTGSGLIRGQGFDHDRLRRKIRKQGRANFNGTFKHCLGKSKQFMRGSKAIRSVIVASLGNRQIIGSVQS